VVKDAISAFQPDLLAMRTHARRGLSVAMVGSLASESLVEAPCDMPVARVSRTSPCRCGRGHRT